MIQSQLNNATKGTKINLDTGGAQGNLDGLNKKFDITYQMANKIYQISKEAIGAMVEEVYTIDKALTEFKKVSDLRGSDLEDYSKTINTCYLTNEKDIDLNELRNWFNKATQFLKMFSKVLHRLSKRLLQAP